MNDFKDGDKVIVKGMYDLRIDGIGIYRGVSKDKWTNGYYRIENEDRHVMLVHPERVTKEE